MASFSLQPGGLVGERYRLRQMIGAGGMGAVWSARDEAQGRDVAVKFLHPSLLRDPMAVQRFFQEAEAGTQLRHANIIETYASGRHVPPDGKDPIPYLVMELLDGEPLTETMQRLGPLWLGAALVLMRDVARAADAAHRAGILHRDLKPANVFLHRGKDGTVTPKVLDFGVSKLLDPALDVGLTSTGMLVGSPSYMSPEQALAKKDIDARSDVWSIGVMLHRCLTAQLLFPVSGSEGMLKHIVEKDVTLDGVEGLPPEVTALLRKCLRRNREERFAKASDLADAIEAAVRERSLETDLRALLPADTAPAAPRPPPDDATEAQSSPPFAREREETQTKLTAAVPARKSAGWVLPVAAVMGAGVVLMAVLGPSSAPHAPQPSAAQSPVEAAPAVAAVVAPPVTPTQEPLPAAGRPAPAASVVPAPVPSARRPWQRPQTARPTDVVRHPGF